MGTRQRGLVVGRHVAVVSPHLDDATLSLGAAIVQAARAGVRVTVLTVLAGRPDSQAPADDWDSARGFATAGEAARARREEDERACARLGAEPVWLPFDAATADADVREQLMRELATVDAVVVPGYPCSHEDHVRVARLVLQDRPAARVGLYVDQPYAMWHFLGRVPVAGERRANLLSALLRRPGFRELQEPEVPPHLSADIPEHVAWATVRPTANAWLAKQRAARAHRSQIRAFGPLTLPGIGVYEWSRGGESIGWIDT